MKKMVSYIYLLKEAKTMNKKYVYKVNYIRDGIEKSRFIEIDKLDIEEVLKIIGGDYRLLGYCIYKSIGYF